MTSTRDTKEPCPNCGHNRVYRGSDDHCGYVEYGGLYCIQCHFSRGDSLQFVSEEEKRIAALEAENAELKRENKKLWNRVYALNHQRQQRKPYGKGHVWTGEDTGIRIEWGLE